MGSRKCNLDQGRWMPCFCGASVVGRCSDGIIHWVQAEGMERTRKMLRTLKTPLAVPKDKNVRVREGPRSTIPAVLA